MAKVRVACPQCRHVYRVEDSHLGHTARCRQCSTTFVLARTKRQDVGALIAALGRDLVADAAPADERAASDALDALVGIGEPAVKPLAKALGKSTRAHEALARIGGEQALQALCAELEGGDPRRLVAAANALARLGDHRAIPALKSHRWSRERDVRAAFADAVATIQAVHREMAEGRWFAVDTANPRDQIERVGRQLAHIVHDPPLLKRALRWHRDFCALMPEMAFPSEADRADTWHRLGTLIFRLLHPGDELTFENGRPTVECPEAAYCFDRARQLQP